MMRRERRGLGQDQAGVTALEFALVAPVFLVMLMAMLNVGQMAYGIAVLNGAVQNAARNSTLEGADTDAADQTVLDAIQPVLPGVEVEGTRKSYFDFADIGRPESFDDSNGDGTCNNSENYVDENANGGWDAEIGSQGNGGASDVTVYTVQATYPPLFTVPFVPEDWSSMTITSSSVRKNQPFSSQAEYSTTAGTCA